MAFRKNILCSSEFRTFWEEINYPASLFEAIVMFELKCNKYFSEKSFKCIALTDLLSEHRFEEGVNPYLLYPLELIRDLQIPILKRKSLNFGNKGFENAIEDFNYIKKSGYYDINLIEKHLFRLGRIGRNKNAYLELDEFYHTHSRIFIYGAGTYGKNLAFYFKLKGWTFQGFVVTNTDDESEDCVSFFNVDIKDHDGIIIAVESYTVFCEICSTIQKKCGKGQIFSFDYEVYDKL